MKKVLTTFILIFYITGFSQIISNQDKLGFGKYFGTADGLFLHDESLLFCANADSLTGGDKNVLGNGGIDMWIVNLEYNHQIFWQKSIGGSGDDFVGKSIALANGDLLFGGGTNSPISGDKQSPSFGNQDVWLVKTDANGNVLWDKTYGGTENDVLKDLIVAENALYLLCQSRSGVSGNKTEIKHGHDDLWLIKTDLSGNIIWQKTYGGNEVDYAETVLLHENSLYLSSTSYSGISGNKLSPPFTSDYSSDSWVLKLDTNGAILEQASFGGERNEISPALTVFNNKLFLTDGSASLQNTGNKTSPHFGQDDGRLIELDFNLNKLSERSFGGDDIDATRLYGFNSLGQAILVGHSRSGISGDKTVTPNGTFNGSFYPADVWLIIYDTINESFVHQQSIGGDALEILIRVNLNDNESLSVICMSESDISGDKTVALTPHQNLPNYLEFWTFDYTYTLGLEEEILKNRISVYPNPFTNKINLTKAFGNQELYFYTTQGGLVLNTKSDEQGVVETTQLAEGMYILKMTDESGNVYTTRVVKQ